MKVYFLTEGGQVFGFGHVTRCLSIYQAFVKEGFEAELIIHGDDSVTSLLEGVQYRLVLWHDAHAEIVKELTHEDIAFVDSYIAPVEIYTSVGEAVKTLVSMDDNQRLQYPAGIVLNSTLYAQELGYMKDDEHVYLLGENYAPLRQSFWNPPVKDVRENVKDVLVSFGGIGCSALIEAIQKCSKEHFDFELHVVDPSKNRLNAEEMMTQMSSVDICLSGGGQTTYELACLGVPTISMCFADNQKRNLKIMADKGFIEYIGHVQSSDVIDQLKIALDKLLPCAERKKRSQIGSAYVDGQGSLRIVKEVVHG